MSAHGSFLPGLFHQGTAHGERRCPHAATSSAGTWTRTVIFGAAECSADAPQLGAFSHPERDISVLYFHVYHVLFLSVLVSALVQVSQVDIRHVGPSGRSSAASSRHPLFQQIPAVHIRFWTSSATINPESMKPESV